MAKGATLHETNQVCLAVTVLFLYMHEGKIGIGKYGSFVKENQKAKLK